MEWEDDASRTLKKVPFFVRKKVRARVEAHVAAQGRSVVTEPDLLQARQQFLNQMENEIRGYQLDSCFAGSGCPHQVTDIAGLSSRIEEKLREAELLSFLRTHVEEPLKFHHEFRVAIAGCPNACSQPQIRDIGIIAACIPKLTQSPCTGCNGCRQVCGENAVHFDENSEKPRIDMAACVFCGACVKECTAGTIVAGKIGYRVMLGGRLGRHPRLAIPLSGIFTPDGVLAIVEKCLDFYKARSRKGERFSRLVAEEDIETIESSVSGYRA